MSGVYHARKMGFLNFGEIVLVGILFLSGSEHLQNGASRGMFMGVKEENIRRKEYNFLGWNKFLYWEMILI